MSAQWMRMPVDAKCGSCPHRRIAAGEYALVFTLRGVRKPRIRCQGCAGDAPPDLPTDDAQPQPRTKKMTPLSATAQKHLTRIRGGR